MIEKLKKKILLIFGISGIIYLVLTLYGDYKNVIASFASFNWLWLPVLLILSFSNYIMRFLKWDYYLRLIKVKIKTIDSFYIFMSGLVMSITPGKMGELLKSYLVKKVVSTPISKTAPIILVERITDFISLVFIALIGAYVFDYGRVIVIGVGIFFFLVIIIIGNKRMALAVINRLERINLIKKYIESIHNAYESSYQMLRPYPLLQMSLLSLVAWAFECLGYQIILVNFGIDSGIFWASFTYAFATIVGAITMLPAGIGVTEGSLTFMVMEKGYPKDIAVASTFIMRVATLWFAMLVGIIAVGIYQKRFGKITEETVTK